MRLTLLFFSWSRVWKTLFGPTSSTTHEIDIPDCAKELFSEKIIPCSCLRRSFLASPLLVCNALTASPPIKSMRDISIRLHFTDIQSVKPTSILRRSLFVAQISRKPAMYWSSCFLFDPSNPYIIFGALRASKWIIWIGIYGSGTSFPSNSTSGDINSPLCIQVLYFIYSISQINLIIKKKTISL